MVEEEKKMKKCAKEMTIVFSIFLILFLIFAFHAEYVLREKYNKAVTCINGGNYDEAVELLNELWEGYRGVDEVIIPATNGKKYENAMECYESGKYEEAIELFEELAESNYEDSKDKISEVKYTQALEYYEDEDYEEALPIFMELGWYTDAHDYYEECLINVASPVMTMKYLEASNYFDSGKYKEALEIFYTIKCFKNSQDFITECERRIGILSTDDE